MIVIKCEGYLEATEKFPNTDTGNEDSIKYLEFVYSYKHGDPVGNHLITHNENQSLKVSITHE